MGDRSRREREPVGGNPVQQGRGEGLGRGDAGDDEHAHETGPDEAEPARVNVGEEHEGRLGVGGRGADCAEQCEVVEAGAPCRRPERASPGSQVLG
jgi:hypothetical protein